MLVTKYSVRGVWKVLGSYEYYSEPYLEMTIKLWQAFNTAFYSILLKVVIEYLSH